MTDKIKKLEPLTEDVQPEFPTLSRGGYVEDTVDDWLTTHLREVNEIINYQNYGVDIVDALEAELASANAEITELRNNALVSQAGSSEDVESLHAELASAKAEIAAANEQLTHAHARIHELENPPAKDEASVIQEETLQASILLQQAAELGAKYIEQAKADGEQIRKDAEATLIDLRTEIEDLEAQRFATFRSLDDFYSQELTKLRANNLFALEAGTDVEEEDGEEAEVTASDVVAEADLAGETETETDEAPVAGEAEVVTEEEPETEEDVAGEADVDEEEVPAPVEEPEAEDTYNAGFFVDEEPQDVPSYVYDEEEEETQFLEENADSEDESK